MSGASLTGVTVIGIDREAVREAVPPPVLPRSSTVNCRASAWSQSSAGVYLALFKAVFTSATLPVMVTVPAAGLPIVTLAVEPGVIVPWATDRVTNTPGFVAAASASTSATSSLLFPEKLNAVYLRASSRPSVPW